MKIELNYNKKDLEEIYFRDDSLSYFKNDQAIFLLVSLVLTLVFIGIAFISIKAIGFVFCFVGITIFQFIKFLIQIFKIRKDRENINKYLSELDNVENFEILLEQYSMKLIMDSEEFEYSWNELTRIECNSIFTVLYESNKQYLIVPAKSMKDEEYSKFLRIMKLKKEIINSDYNKT